MDDRSCEELELDPAWDVFGRRLATGAGALFALLSLWRHVPVPLAALRGGLTVLCVSWVWRLGLAALRRAMLYDRAAAPPAPTEELGAVPQTEETAER